MIVDPDSVFEVIKAIGECESAPYDGDIIMAIHPYDYMVLENEVMTRCVISMAVDLGYVETFDDPSGHERHRLTVEGSRLFEAISYGESA